MSDNEAKTPAISATAVAAHVEKNDIFLLDIRKSKGKTQIYGAINYDRKELAEADRLVLPLPKSDGLIVLYDEKGDGSHLEEIAEKLRTDGYATVRALEGGFAAWEAAGGKTEDVTMKQPVPLVTEHQISR